ncbi:hypothetical protein KEM48_010793 [Puccinia striiformis f. sp. tritici PST-130]|nr:hypothetical protein KEM48_010793 [Puccinia striiformis f. sp. tritici PST-130]
MITLGFLFPSPKLDNEGSLIIRTTTVANSPSLQLSIILQPGLRVACHTLPIVSTFCRKDLRGGTPLHFPSPFIPVNHSLNQCQKANQLPSTKSPSSPAKSTSSSHSSPFTGSFTKLLSSKLNFLSSRKTHVPPSAPSRAASISTPSTVNRLRSSVSSSPSHQTTCTSNPVVDDSEEGEYASADEGDEGFWKLPKSSHIAQQPATSARPVHRSPSWSTASYTNPTLKRLTRSAEQSLTRQDPSGFPILTMTLVGKPANLIILVHLHQPPIGLPSICNLHSASPRQQDLESPQLRPPPLNSEPVGCS